MALGQRNGTHGSAPGGELEGFILHGEHARPAISSTTADETALKTQRVCDNELERAGAEAENGTAATSGRGDVLLPCTRECLAEDLGGLRTGHTVAADHEKRDAAHAE